MDRNNLSLCESRTSARSWLDPQEIISEKLLCRSRGVGWSGSWEKEVGIL